MSAERTYVIEQNEQETCVPTTEEACRLVRLACDETDADLWVLIDHGRRQRSFLERLAGASDRDVEPCFHLEKTGEVAALTFLDGAWSEYRAMDPGHPVEATEAQRLKISGGELTPQPLEFCMDASRALEAALAYLREGERPAWLTYKYVK